MEASLTREELLAPEEDISLTKKAMSSIMPEERSLTKPK